METPKPNRAPTDWASWPETYRTLQQTYYTETFPAADQNYALAGLQRYFTTWQDEHGHRCIPMHILDGAAAHEIWYQHVRGREFRRPCAALSACWISLIVERPERILDRHDRFIQAQDRKARKNNAKETK